MNNWTEILDLLRQDEELIEALHNMAEYKSIYESKRKFYNIIESYPKLYTDAGETKMVIMCDDFDTVLKIPFDMCLENPCQREVEIYKEAVKRGISRYFAEVEMVGFLGEYPCYEMQRVGNVSNEELFYTVAESFNIDTEDLAEEEIVEELLSAQMDVSEYNEYFDLTQDFPGMDQDWHFGNVGLDDDDIIVAIDYSGYVYDIFRQGV